MANPLSQSTQAERTKQIPNQIESLSGLALTLGDKLNQLRTNLDGCLLPSPPSSPQAVAEDHSSFSPTADEIAKIAGSVEECIVTVNDIQSRLDI